MQGITRLSVSCSSISSPSRRLRHASLSVAQDTIFLSPFGMLGAGTAFAITLVLMASVLLSPLFHSLNFCASLRHILV